MVEAASVAGVVVEEEAEADSREVSRAHLTRLCLLAIYHTHAKKTWSSRLRLKMSPILMLLFT